MSIKWEQFEALMHAAEKPKRQLTQSEQQLDERRNGCGPAIGTFLLPAMVALGLLAGGCSADELPPTNDEAITCHEYGAASITMPEGHGLATIEQAITVIESAPGACTSEVETAVNRSTGGSHVTHPGHIYNIPHTVSDINIPSAAYTQAR